MRMRSEAAGRRAHTTLGGDVHPRVRASSKSVRALLGALPEHLAQGGTPRRCAALDTPRTWQISVRNKDVKAGAGARADYPY